MSLAKWTAGALAGISMLALAAQASAGEVRVTVAEYSAKTGPYFQEVEKEFEAANPGIDLKVEIVPWDVLLQKLTTDIAAGTNADLSIIGTRWLIDFVQQDVAEPLDSYMNDEFKGRFIDTFLSPSIMDGKTYGLPIAASALGSSGATMPLEQLAVFHTGMLEFAIPSRARGNEYGLERSFFTREG